MLHIPTDGCVYIHTHTHRLKSHMVHRYGKNINMSMHAYRCTQVSVTEDYYCYVSAVLWFMKRGQQDREKKKDRRRERKQR